MGIIVKRKKNPITYPVEKSNRLNEMRAAGLSLQEIRFLCIYLSKINPYDKSTRTVRFSLSDYVRIMELFDSSILLELGKFDRTNLKQISQSTGRLLQKIVTIRTETGGYSQFQLFSKFAVDRDHNGEWYVEAKAHDDMLDGLMFSQNDNFRRKGYIAYQLWNALRLKSSVQIRMYEILKQYEKIGRREVSVSDLQAMLGIKDEDYPRWGDFKNKVIRVCQKEIKETTDIWFDFERGSKGKRGKWLTIIFYIYKNDVQITFDDYETITEYPEAAIDGEREDNVIMIDTVDSSPGAPTLQLQQITEAELTEQNEPETSAYKDIDLYMEACDNEFSVAEVEALLSIVFTMDVPAVKDGGIEIARYHYLREKYAVMKTYAAKKGIKRRFNYLRKIIMRDREEQQGAKK